MIITFSKDAFGDIVRGEQGKLAYAFYYNSPEFLPAQQLTQEQARAKMWEKFNASP